MRAAGELLSGRAHPLYVERISVKSRDGIASNKAARTAALAGAFFTACAAVAAGASGQEAPPAKPPVQAQQPGTLPQSPAPQPGQQAPPTPAQGSTQQPSERPPDPVSVFRTHTEEVIVPVLVRDSSGEPVLDLRRRDFRILEDDVEQKISLFTNEPFPLSVVLLVDDDLPKGVAEKVDRSLGAAIGGMAEGDEMAVVTFAQFPKLVADFGTNLNQMHTLLTRTELESHYPLPGTPTMTMTPNPTTSQTQVGVPDTARVQTTVSKDLDDAMLYCADMLRTRARERRKMVLVISDGRNSHNNTASYGQALRGLLSAEASVYGIGVSAAVLDRRRAAIARYTDATGGDIVYASSQGGIEENYARLLTESRNRYTLSYQPRGTDRSKDFHEIEVRVERPGLKVIARDGYYVLVGKQ